MPRGVIGLIFVTITQQHVKSFLMAAYPFPFMIINMPDNSADAKVPISRPIKRKKTLRACDYCRAHRIRCEYVAEGKDGCQHCIKYGFECTKVAPVLPDKRKKIAQDGIPEEEEERSQGLEPGYLGPSSLTQLVHSSCVGDNGLEKQMRELGNRYDHHWQSLLGHCEGSGLLVGREEFESTGRKRTARFTFSRLYARLAEELGSITILDSLNDKALQSIITMFPVISASESASVSGKNFPPGNWWQRYNTWSYNSTPPTPIPRVVRLIHCALASLSREVPYKIRHSILTALHEHLNNGESAKLSQTTTLANAQVLILLGMNQDLHSYEESTAMSMMWQRVGTGLRMATELAVHRNVSSKAIPIAQLHRRWRVWGACVATDKWLALRLGQVQTIDLEDCDTPLPFLYPDHFADESEAEGVACFSTIHHLSKLSVLLGRVVRLTSTPFHLERTTDHNLGCWQRDMDTWVEELPQHFAVSTKLKLPQANDLFNLLAVAVEFTFLRAFMLPSPPIPAHITFRPDHARWSNLILRAEMAMDWMTTPIGLFYLDTWAITVYPLVCCIMINLSVYRSIGSLRAAHYLDCGSKIIQDWARAAAEGLPADRSSKRKVADMVAILRASVKDDPSNASIEDILNKLT